MADDTKKVLVPKDRNGDDHLDNDFTAPNADYSALPGFQNSGQDDLPLESPPPAHNVQQVSLGSARQKVLEDTRINPQQPGNTDTLDSQSQFIPSELANSTLDRPSTLRLGQFFNKGLPGIRKPVGTATAAKALRDIDTESQSMFPEHAPQGRTIAGTPGPAYGNPDQQAGSGPVVQRTVSAVLTRNRFAGMNKRVYAPANSNPDEQVVGSFQSEVGAYNPESPTDNPTQAGFAFSMEDLKDTAANLISQAAGFSPGGRSTNSNQRFASEGVNATSVRPRNLRHTKVNRNAFVRSKASTGQFDEPDNDSPRTTFGQLNTPVSPFGGLDPKQMKALADSIIKVTISALSSGTNKTFIETLTGEGSSGIAPGSQPYTKGKYIEKINPSATLRTDLGFTYTSLPFDKAIKIGMSLLFGYKSPSMNMTDNDWEEKIQLSKNLDAARQNVANTPGFYVNFCRAVMRDAQVLEEKFKTVAAAAAGSAESTVGAITMIDAFRSSKLVACMNVLATTGDAVYSRTVSPYKVDQLQSSGDPGLTPFGRPTEIPGMHYRPSSHAMKSRDSKVEPGISPDSMRLAWRGSSVPSMYLLPAEIEYGSVHNSLQTLSNDSPAAAHISMEGITKAESNGRLPQEFVENHERVLDAEYVPFYFHDLRTGEVIAFHAFLNDLSDSYSARYGSNQAIGRADPVQIYQNTSRDIGFSFYVAATSREDFNEMWFKINKLVTMLYPQYTQGRSTSEQTESKSARGFLSGLLSGQNFIMPFSQVQSSSPMIRLRIGDVVKTNFSKFNLARLFGQGTEQFAPNGKVDKLAAGATLKVMRILFQGLGVLNNSSGANSAATSATLSSGAASINFLEVMRLLRQKAKLKPSSGDWMRSNFYGLSSGDVVRICFPSVRYLVNANTGEKFFIPFKDVYGKVRSVEYGEKGEVFYKVGLASSADMAFLSLDNVGGLGEMYLLNHHDASLIPGGLFKEFLAINAVRLAVGITNWAELYSGMKFLSPAENAVVRSFDQASGKGLPGFISQMSFNWIDDKVTWEVDKGSRAPKLARISCRFQPVHDIAPGLDHLGYNRAPVYPVGDVMNDIIGTSGDILDSQVADAIADVASLATGGDGTSSDIKQMKLDDDS